MDRSLKIVFWVTLLSTIIYYLIQFVTEDLHLHVSIRSDIEHVVEFWKDSENTKRTQPLVIELDVLEQREYEVTESSTIPIFYEKARIVEQIEWIGTYEFQYEKRLYKVSTDEMVMTFTVETNLIQIVSNYTFTRSSENTTEVQQIFLLTTPRLFMQFSLSKARQAHSTTMQRFKEFIENIVQ